MTAQHREREMRHWLLLNEQEQHEAIQKLARQGFGDHSIASATGLSVEMVRKILGEHQAVRE